MAKAKMSDAHKAAMAEGRTESRAVKAYLEAIDHGPRKRGRQRTVPGIEKRLEAIDASLDGATALTRLQLIQERSDLQAELAAKQGGTEVDLPALRREFVKVAKSYGERKGISYGTWRAVGVDADTLEEAGIVRTRG